MNSPILKLSEPLQIISGISVQSIDCKHFLTQAFQTTYIEVLPGGKSPIDSHEDEEYWVILKGSGLLTYDHHIYRLSALDQCYFSSHKSHQIENDGDTPLLILSIYW